MAYVDMTRSNDFMKKKSICLFAGEVNEGADVLAGEIPAGTNANYLLANLPENAIITNAYIHVETGSNAATSATATLGTTEGGTQILSAGNLKTTGKQGTFTGQSLTGFGKSLYLGVTYVGAATNAGKFKVVVEYVEYRKDSGELTRITN